MITGTKSEKEEKEKCVSCDRETQYTKDTPIEKRFYYIEGAGQLCGLCYNEIYVEEEQEHLRGVPQKELPIFI